MATHRSDARGDARPPDIALLAESDSTRALGSALRIVRKRGWMIAAIAVSIPLLVAFVVSKQPKIYEATTTLVIDSSVPQYLGSSFKDVVELESNWWTAQETLQTELRVVHSYSQAQAVAKALCDRTIGPQHEPAVKRLLSTVDCTNPETLKPAALALQGLVRSDPVKDSRVVNLIVDHTDAEMAALIANTAAEVYRDRNLEHRLAQSKGAADWLGGEYGDLTQQLNDAEHALIEFKKKNNVVQVNLEDLQNDLSNKHKKLSDELNSVQVKLIGLRAQREEYASFKTDDPLREVRPGIGDSPLMQRLKELYGGEYAKLIELQGRYGEKYPKLHEQELRVQAIKDEMAREASSAEKFVEREFQKTVKQERDLRAALDAATKEALQLEQRAIEYNRLKRNFDRLQKLSEQVGGRERETSLAEHLNTNNVRILDPALVPLAPISPNLSRTVGASFALALLLAVGCALLIEMLDSSIKSQEDVEKGVGLVFLGMIPRIAAGLLPKEPRSASKDLFVLSHPKSSVAECCRAIRTNLLFMNPDDPPRLILVTSAAPQDGKTAVAINLAITMAQSGLRILLVDTDMRRPRLHKSFDIPATSDGLSKAIVGQADVMAMVRETGVPGLSLLPCGASPPNPAELLHTKRFQRIVEELGQRFDRVIFDSPPVGAVTDAAILSRLTSGTILIARGFRTSREDLNRARRLLADGEVTMLGCILNDVDLSRQGSYQYYYYSGSYGDEGKPDELRSASRS